jgi:hypothetical protein
VKKEPEPQIRVELTTAGESGVIETPLSVLDPDLAELVRRGEVTLDLRYTSGEISPERIETIVEFWVDGRLHSKGLLVWRRRPSLLDRIRKLFRRS